MLSIKWKKMSSNPTRTWQNPQGSHSNIRTNIYIYKLVIPEIVIEIIWKQRDPFNRKPYLHSFFLRQTSLSEDLFFSPKPPPFSSSFPWFLPKNPPEPSPFFSSFFFLLFSLCFSLASLPSHLRPPSHLPPKSLPHQSPFAAPKHSSHHHVERFGKKVGKIKRKLPASGGSTIWHIKIQFNKNHSPQTFVSLKST